MKQNITVRDMAYIALMAVVIALCSWISVPAAVPFTMQTFAVFCALLLLGGRRGTFAVALYILLGAFGLPVFSGFRGGIGALLGPTGGYIVGFLLCAVDEVLRGTNTIERISASAEVLKALSRPGTLCLIATHDSELNALSGGAYQLAHFEETVTDTGILFDYTLKPGPAETRNAIHLLKLMGFDSDIVTAAHDRADRYVKTGKWE